jgi:glutamine synthetase
LKPGFEAPICIVASIGNDVETPSRNRTVLAGLIRDMQNPMSVRFEVRSPNPHTNTYLAIAAIYQAMLDGIKYAVESGKTAAELEKEFSKKYGEAADYLEKDRAYRSEEDVFEHYTEDERVRMFGNPPATVWENLQSLSRYPSKCDVLAGGGVFDKAIIASYIKATCTQWTMELGERIIAENTELVRSCVKLHKGGEFTDYDEELWTRINGVRRYLMKDSLKEKSLFTQIREAIENGEYDKVSALQLEMAEKIKELKRMYAVYRRNMMEFEW